MSGTALLALCLLAPLAQGGALLAAGLLPRAPAVREGASILLAFCHAGLALALLQATFAGDRGMLVLAEPLPGARLAFANDPLGAAIAALIALLSALGALYGAGHGRASGVIAPARAGAFAAGAAGMACAASLAANLLTFFAAYVGLMLLAFSLIVQDGAPASRAAGRRFLRILLSAAIGLLLPAIIWTYAVADGVDFRPGGVLEGKVATVEANVLLLLFVFGLGQATPPPFHRWAIAGTRTPAAAAAIVHGVALPSVGALGVLKVSLYVFGPAMEYARAAAVAILALALAGAVAASIAALSKPDLRERLAYSTLAQMGLAVAGAMIASPAGAFASAFQIVAHAVAKFTLHLVAGAVEVVTGRTAAPDYEGLGRRMPWAFSAFALAALSIAGAPPLAGAWASLWLIAGAGEAGMGWAVVLILACGAAGFCYACPLAARALFGPSPAYPFSRPDAASVLVIFPAAAGGLATLGLLFLVDPMARFLAPSLR